MRLWPFYRAGYLPTRGSWLDQNEPRVGWCWAHVGPWVIGWGHD